jgi:predicted DNA-binding transcriptional regulator YafY
MRKGEHLGYAISLAMPVSDMKGGDEIFQKVVQAIDEKKVLRVRQYENAAGNKIVCNISPCALYFKYHAWYLLGMSPEIDKKLPAVFRLNRMHMVEVLPNESFIESFWPQEELRGNIERDWHPKNSKKDYFVKLRITGFFAQAVMETEWFKGEKKKCEPNGEVIYEVSLKGLEWITLWIMRSLDCIEVLEPKELRVDIDRRVNEYLNRRKGHRGKIDTGRDGKV